MGEKPKCSKTVVMRYNYKAIRQDFMAGDSELDSYSRERTGDPQSPPLQQLRNHASRYDWIAEREQLKMPTVSAVVPVDGDTSRKAVVVSAIDAVDVVKRNLAVARMMQNISVRRMKLLLENPSELAKLSVNSAIRMNEIAHRIECSMLGIATEHHSVQLQQMNFQSLSDEQIEAIARGEMPSIDIDSEAV